MAEEEERKEEERKEEERKEEERRMIAVKIEKEEDLTFLRFWIFEKLFLDNFINNFIFGFSFHFQGHHVVPWQWIFCAHRHSSHQIYNFRIFQRRHIS